MRKIITSFLIALIGLSVAESQPLAENGFFYNDFSLPSYSGMTFSTNGCPGVVNTVSGANVSGSGPLVYSIGATSSTACGAGLENQMVIAFGKPTAGFFNSQSANLTLNLTSSQGVPVPCLVILSNALPVGGSTYL